MCLLSIQFGIRKIERVLNEKILAVRAETSNIRSGVYVGEYLASLVPVIFFLRSH